MSKHDLVFEIFKLYKTGARTQKKVARINNEKLSDPELIGGVLIELISERQWDSGLTEGNFFANWSKIVGEEISQHAKPISILDGALTIQSSSTAWATQLQLIYDELLKTIQKNTKSTLIEKLIIVAPNAPTWKKGIRSIRNARGPRDTYG